MHQPLFGRDGEVSSLLELLHGGLEGRSGCLVVHGEAGSGKTALLDRAARAAAGFATVQVVGFESEMELSFAGLHRLLASLDEPRRDLPGRQREALDFVFGEGHGASINPFMAGLASLTAISRQAVEQPLLCIVDDAQWLDHESLVTLAFVARRLLADRVVMLFGVRAPAVESVSLLAGIPQMQVSGLADREARAMLRSAVDVPIAASVADRITAESNGSPLAIAELAMSLTPAQLSGTNALPAVLPIGPRLEAHFLERVQALPEPTQTYLLLVAAEPSGDPRLLDDASRHLGLPSDAAEPAVRADLLIVARDVRFRHPLIRSAVYNGARPAVRRAAHGALAGSERLAHQPDRRTWHLAAAAVGPSETVARELENSAAGAQARGGFAEAGAFYARAAELSPDRATRVERGLAAGWALYLAGRPQACVELLGHLDPWLVDDRDRARAQRVRVLAGYNLGRSAQSVVDLLRAAQHIQPYDIRAARSTLLVALVGAIGATPGPAVAGGGLVDVAMVGRSMSLPSTLEPTAGDLICDAILGLFADGHAAAYPAMRDALDRYLARTEERATESSWVSLVGWLAGAIGDVGALHELASRLVDRNREEGPIGEYSAALLYLGHAELVRGSLREARAHFAECAELVAMMVADAPDPGSLLVMAWEGRADETYAAADSVLAASRFPGNNWLAPYAASALTVLELGSGRYGAAFAASSKDYDDSPFLSGMSFTDLVEAAVRSGERAAARRACDDFAARAVVNATPLALGLLARARALVAADADAERWYIESLELLGPCEGPAPAARSELVYGEWLHGMGRSVDARAHLRSAHEAFARMGARAFADRARLALLAAGEHTARPVRPVSTDLTAHERRVARLAVAGATNAEIAEQLFISASTVEYHLRKVFRKLSISSRRQLTDQLVDA